MMKFLGMVMNILSTTDMLRKGRQVCAIVFAYRNRPHDADT